MSIEPGFAKRERAVIVPKRPVVIARACKGWAGVNEDEGRRSGGGVWKSATKVAG